MENTTLLNEKHSTNEIIKQLNQDITLANKTDLEVLKHIVQLSEVEYYNNADSDNILNDNVYDYIKELIRTKVSEIEGKNEMLFDDGMSHVPETVGRMCKLPIWMGATTKVNHGTGQLKIWKGKYEGPWCISAKEDGASALYVNIDGQHKLFSRGKGDGGQNISELLKYLNLPLLEDGSIIRGELMIKQSIFNQKYKRNDPSETEKFKNTRNSVSGMVNKLGYNASKGVPTLLEGLKNEFIQDIEFIAYELVSKPPLKASEQFIKLEEIFNSNGKYNMVARHEVLIDIDEETLSLLYDKYIKELDYGIDGLVVCSNHEYERPYGKNPDYLIAYKKPLVALTSITEVQSVEWNISKDGLIKPVVIITPIELDGVTISRATGYNAKNICDNMIGPGAIVEVTRSGGVIPKIIKVIQPCVELTMPKQDFYWNETNVDIFVKYSDNDNFSEERRDMNIKQLHHFLVKIETKGVGPKAVATMYDEGIRTIIQLLSLTEKDLHFFGDKTAQNIVKTINERKSKLTLPILCGASMIFGRLIGIRRLEIIFEVYPNLMELDCIINNNIVDIENLLSGINGFASKTAKQVACGFPNMLVFLKELKNIGIIPASSLVVNPINLVVNHIIPLNLVVNPINLSLNPINVVLTTTNQVNLNVTPTNLLSNPINLSFNPVTSTNIVSKPLILNIIPKPIVLNMSNREKKQVMGKNILMTGFRDSDIKDFIIRSGGKVQSSLTKKTDILIIKNSDTQNTKVNTAIDRGLPVITAEDFKSDYM